MEDGTRTMGHVVDPANVDPVVGRCRQRRWARGICLVLVLAGSVGCADDPPDESADAPVPDECAFGERSEPVEELIGLSLADAAARAGADELELRVVGEDGRCNDLDTALDPGRVDVYVVDGEVVRADVPVAPSG